MGFDGQERLLLPSWTSIELVCFQLPLILIQMRTDGSTSLGAPESILNFASLVHPERRVGKKDVTSAQTRRAVEP